ncbi:zinc-dependent metalloprotease [Thaumasiovibrio subtropicus]|uniref:zinc-dependent metalloprotease n=1 Tax=Thaumasiovibrio subtropicus TaxID=1891207 RepID=UPI001C842885|nr:zinc-dependent metalloprotease [Thaumasiovibrio subtropicus]
MITRKLPIAAAIGLALSGCGADDQAYDTVSKPVEQVSKNSIRTDKVYLYMPSMAKAPDYAVSMKPFWQGEEKLVTVAFTENGLNVRMLNKDFISQNDIDASQKEDIDRFVARWADEQTNHRPVITIPGKYVDYQCKEDSWGDCTNKEEKVDENEVAWEDRGYFVPDYEKVVVHERTWDDLFTFSNGCYSVKGSPRLATDAASGWEGYELSETGALNFEVEQDYTVNNSWRCMIGALSRNNFDMSELTFTVSKFYSLVPLDELRSKEYDPVVYRRGDRDSFGFFASTVGRPDVSYTSGKMDQEFDYLHRFNPDLPAIEYHLSNSFDLNEETKFYKQITIDVVNKINPQLTAVGMPPIKLHEPSGKQSGDLRYNVVNLIDEPLANGLAGYGPSAVNPVTGEIVHAHVNQYSGVLRAGASWTWESIVKDYNNPGRVDPLVKPVVEEAPTADVPADAETKSLAVASQDASTVLESAYLDQEIASLYNEATPEGFESLEEAVLRYNEVMSNSEDYSNVEEFFIDEELEARFWSENNMFPITALRAGATLKTLPTEIGGMTFDWMNPVLWENPEQAGTAEGRLKRWKDLDKRTQADISLFLSGVFYAKTLVHEFGHNFGLRHNFKGSNDYENYFTESELATHGLKMVPGYSSIMDYNPSMLNALPVFGPYDLAALRFGYSRQVEADVTSREDGTIAESEFVSVKHLDEQLLDAVLDPYADFPVPTYDGVIKGLTASVQNFNPEASSADTPEAKFSDINIRDFKYCTDGNVSLNNDCNRHDEGRNRSEIMAYNLESYNDWYYTRTIRGDRATFTESTLSRYALSRISFFMRLRDSIQDYEDFRGPVGRAFGLDNFSDYDMMNVSASDSWICNTENPYFAEHTFDYDFFCGAAKSVSQLTSQLYSVLTTPDHTCEVTDADDKVSYVNLYDLIDDFRNRSYFEMNHVPESCFDESVVKLLDSKGQTVIAEAGKYLNSGSAPVPAPENQYSYMVFPLLARYQCR